MTFTFTAKNGMCPECYALGRKWYIADRSSGGNRYEYRLMSVTTQPQAVYQFKDMKEIAAWLNGFESISEKNEWWIGCFIRRWTIADYYGQALIEKDGIQYRLDKLKYTLTALPKPQPETGWCSTYRECLALAKEILLERSKQAG